MKLNLGCGRNTLDGWTNLDCRPGDRIDYVADLEKVATDNLPFWSDSVDELLLSHVIEHIHNVLPLMEELHRIAKPNALLTIRVPYGSSDDAWEDPTHVRPYFLGSFTPFAQPYYWRADYGYRGDWRTESIKLMIPAQLGSSMNAQQLSAYIAQSRNIVREMIVTLVAVKPIREQRKELLTTPSIQFILI